MKNLLLAAAVATFAAPAFAQDVGVSIRLGQPGFYGQIDIGDMPQPVLVYARPVAVEYVPEYADVAPIYLHVPPGYERHWRQHCREYDACGRPVYFVHHDWYENEYVPRYRYREHDEGRYEGRREDWEHGDGDHGYRRRGHGEHGDHEHGDHEHGDHDD